MWLSNTRTPSKVHRGQLRERSLRHWHAACSSLQLSPHTGPFMYFKHWETRPLYLLSVHGSLSEQREVQQKQTEVLNKHTEVQDLLFTNLNIKSPENKSLLVHVVARPALPWCEATIDTLHSHLVWTCACLSAEMVWPCRECRYTVYVQVTFLKLEIYPTPGLSAEWSGTCSHRRGASLRVQREQGRERMEEQGRDKGHPVNGLQVAKTLLPNLPTVTGLCHLKCL